MKRWDQRPFEIRNLFNPAFCGLVIFRALNGYEKENSRGMPFSLSLLVLPLCLYKSSREIIANNPRSYLLKTTEMNPEIMIGFAERVTQMLPYTFEGFGLLMGERLYNNLQMMVAFRVYPIRSVRALEELMK